MSIASKPSMATPEGRAALGFGWQDTGPVLSNLTPSVPHRHYWTALEGIVWIATRSLDCVGGARTFLHDGVDPLQRPTVDDRLAPWPADVAAQVLLAVHLKSDLAGHHPDCPQKRDEGSCTCSALGRARFCRCRDAKRTSILTCSCIGRARYDLLDALVGGLAATGQPDGQTIYEKIDAAAFAGAKQEFRDGDGLSLIPEYRNIRILRLEIEQRWPADPSPLQEKTDEFAELLAGPAFKGRPPDYVKGLQTFIERLTLGSVLAQQFAEAAAIAKVLPKRPLQTTVARWLKPYFKQIVWDKGRATNAEAVAAMVRSDVKNRLRSRMNVDDPTK